MRNITMFWAACVLTACGSTEEPTTTTDTGVTQEAAVDTSTVDTGTATADSSPSGDTSTADTTVAETAVDAAMGDTSTGGLCTAAGPASACNALVMPASAATITPTIGMMPAVSGGGTVPNGVYRMTKEILPSGTAKPHKRVAVWEGGCYQTYIVRMDGTDSRANGTVTYAAGKMSVALTCPAAFSASASYKVEMMGGKARILELADAPMTAYREWEQL